MVSKTWYIEYLVSCVPRQTQLAEPPAPARHAGGSIRYQTQRRQRHLQCQHKQAFPEHTTLHYIVGTLFLILVTRRFPSSSLTTTPKFTNVMSITNSRFRFHPSNRYGSPTVYRTFLYPYCCQLRP